VALFALGAASVRAWQGTTVLPLFRLGPFPIWGRHHARCSRSCRRNAVQHVSGGSANPSTARLIAFQRAVPLRATVGVDAPPDPRRHANPSAVIQRSLTQTWMLLVRGRACGIVRVAAKEFGVDAIRPWQACVFRRFDRGDHTIVLAPRSGDSDRLTDSEWTAWSRHCLLRFIDGCVTCSDVRRDRRVSMTFPPSHIADPVPGPRAT